MPREARSFEPLTAIAVKARDVRAAMEPLDTGAALDTLNDRELVLRRAVTCAPVRTFADARALAAYIADYPDLWDMVEPWIADGLRNLSDGLDRLAGA
jgi:hypothetical protein